MCGWISIVSAITIAVLLVCLVKMMADSERERKAYQNRPVKPGDMYVLWDWENKCYNVCFFVKEAHEGYYVGNLYSLINGKKRKCELVSVVLSARKGFNYAGLYNIRDVSFTDKEIKQVGFERV